MLKGKLIRRDLVLLYLTNVAQKVPSFLAAMVLTRVFAPDAMGGFFFASSLAFFFVLLTIFGTNQYLTRAVATRPEQGLDRLGEVLALRLLLTVLAIALMNGIMLVFAPQLAIVVLLTSLAALVGDLQHSFGSYLIGLRHFKIRLLIALCGAVVLIVAVPLAVRAGATLPQVLLCYVVSSLVVVGVSAIVVRTRFGPFPLRMDPRVLWRLVLVCWPFVVLDALQIIQFKVDTLMIFALVSTEAVAQYETAYKLLEVSQYLVRPVAMIAFPVCVAMAAAGNWAEVRRLTFRTIAIAAVVGLGLALLVAPTAGLIMTGVWGPSYAVAAPILRVLFLTAPFLFVAIVASILANAIHLERVLVRLMAGATLLNIALNCGAIPIWGALGAAWATFASELFIAVTVGALLLRTLRPRASAAGAPEDDHGRRRPRRLAIRNAPR
ncbi:MAG: oligosaccharide flippase family protein [Geminicoccaceae bacterium]